MTALLSMLHSVAGPPAVFRSVIFPTVLIAMLLTAFVGLVLHMSTSRSDALALSSQTHLIRKALEQNVATIANDQEASTLWDDAVLQLNQPQLNYDWLDNNLGIWFHTYYGHDEAYVLNPADEPIYAMTDGERRDAGTYRSLKDSIRPLIRDLRHDLKDGYWSKTKAIVYLTKQGFHGIHNPWKTQSTSSPLAFNPKTQRASISRPCTGLKVPIALTADR